MRKKIQTGIVIVLVMLISVKPGDQRTGAITEKAAGKKYLQYPDCVSAVDSSALPVSKRPAGPSPAGNQLKVFKGFIPTSPQVVRNWFKVKYDSTNG